MKRILVRWKIYIDRARMYIGYVQFLMLGIIMLKTFQDYTIVKFLFQNAMWTFPLLIILFTFGCAIIGYIESKTGIREEEQRKLTSLNPTIMEILERLKKLEK